MINFVTTVEDMYAHEKSASRKRPNEVQEGIGNPTLKRRKQEESSSSKNLSVAYICRPPPKVGRMKDMLINNGQHEDVLKIFFFFFHRLSQMPL